MVAAQLIQHQGQQQASIRTMMTGTAAHWVLQYGQVLKIAEAEAREPEFRRFAARANHVVNTIRASRLQVQAPTEELLSHGCFRCTVGIPIFNEE